MPLASWRIDAFPMLEFLLEILEMVTSLKGDRAVQPKLRADVLYALGVSRKQQGELQTACDLAKEAFGLFTELLPDSHEVAAVLRACRDAGTCVKVSEGVFQCREAAVSCSGNLCEPGQIALFDQLERRSPAGRHMVDPVGEPELRRALGCNQRMQVLFQRGPHLVQRRVNRRDAVDDQRHLAAHDLRQGGGRPLVGDGEQRCALQAQHFKGDALRVDSQTRRNQLELEKARGAEQQASVQLAQILRLDPSVSLHASEGEPTMLRAMAFACSLILACKRCRRCNLTVCGVSSTRSAAGVPGRRE